MSFYRILPAIMVLAACKEPQPAPAAELSGEPTRAWMQLLYQRVQAEGYSPPVASRTFAYTGVAGFEAMRFADVRSSFSGRLNDMPVMPEIGGGAGYDASAASTAAVSVVASALFPSDESLAAIAALRSEQLTALDLDDAVLQASIAHGEAVGQAVVAWAEADGYAGTRGLSWEPPEGDGFWTPTPPAYAPPLEPYWGTLRTFAVADSSTCPAPAPPSYSEELGTPFFAEGNEVYETTLSLTAEQLEIATFWADNPGQTGTPPGHWMWIATLALEQDGASLAQAAEVHALLGVALADAFVTSWQTKYETNVVRPVTWIHRCMDDQWESPVGTPPFPEYTSGHSVSSGAASVVLEALLGDRTIVDTTHEGRAPRTFDSFAAMADEAALSRLYGGIHYRAAIELGLDQGACVGEGALAVR